MKSAYKRGGTVTGNPHFFPIPEFFTWHLAKRRKQNGGWRVRALFYASLLKAGTVENRDGKKITHSRQSASRRVNGTGRARAGKMTAAACEAVSQFQMKVTKWRRVLL